MQAYLSKGHLVPSIPYKWHQKWFLITNGWDGSYKEQLQMYSDLFSSDVDGCTIEND